MNGRDIVMVIVVTVGGSQRGEWSIDSAPLTLGGEVMGMSVPYPQ